MGHYFWGPGKGAPAISLCLFLLTIQNDFCNKLNLSDFSFGENVNLG